MFISIPVLSIVAVFIVGYCILLNMSTDHGALTSAWCTIAAGATLAIDGAINIEFLRSSGVIHTTTLGASWLIVIMVLTLIVLYIYWLSYLTKDGRIKGPLMFSIVIFIGFLLLLVVITVVCKYGWVMPPNCIM